MPGQFTMQRWGLQPKQPHHNSAARPSYKDTWLSGKGCLRLQSFLTLIVVLLTLEVIAVEKLHFGDGRDRGFTQLPRNAPHRPKILQKSKPLRMDQAVSWRLG